MAHLDCLVDVPNGTIVCESLGDLRQSLPVLRQEALTGSFNPAIAKAAGELQTRLTSKMAAKIGQSQRQRGILQHTHCNMPDANYCKNFFTVRKQPDLAGEPS
jgi:hypothetical protein